MESAAEHERMTACAETVLQKLEPPYRVVRMYWRYWLFRQQTYDIEVWLPGQNEGKGMYREISSVELWTVSRAA